MEILGFVIILFVILGSAWQMYEAMDGGGFVNVRYFYPAFQNDLLF